MTGSGDLYPGELTKEGWLVTINYRLGPLSFAHPDSGGHSGNQAIWIVSVGSSHIERFGGDPGNVTAGESAGLV